MEEFFQMLRKNVIVAYRGTFDKSVLAVIARNIESNVDDTKIAKQFFKIFIELAQNISFYSAEQSKGKHSGIGMLVIKQYDNHYNFATGNLIFKNTVNKVVEKCERINNLDRDGLRQYKREMLGKPDGEFGGANIGLIHVALISNNIVDYNIRKMDDNVSFLTLGVKINR